MEIERALTEIDAALEVGEDALDAAERTHRTSGQYSEAITVCASTVQRLTASGSAYERQTRRILDRAGMGLPFYVEQLVGILKGLRRDIEAGYLQSFEEELRADVFADFLEMAERLVADRYLLPAAVVAGSALEAHLRALALREGIATQARGKTKRAGMLNDNLRSRDVYRSAEHKQVMAWQDLRNSAAHGDADADFTASEIRLMIQGIRDFISRHPA